VKKGVILEVDDRFLTLLTPEGEFLHAHKQDKQYALGEEILFSPLQVDRNRKKHLSFANKLFSLKTLVTSAAALLLFMASLFPFNTKREVYAYMSIDVNPSLELGVNKNMEVIELNAYNSEGEEIIAGIDKWKEKDVSVITEILIDEMETQGFLEQNREVTISTVSIEKNENKLEEKMAEEVSEIQEVVLEENLVLTVMEATVTDRKAAKEFGMSTGKYKKELKIKKLDKSSKRAPETIPSTPQQNSPVPAVGDEKDNHQKHEGKKEYNQYPNDHNSPGQIKKEEKNAKELDSGKIKERQQTNTDNWGHQKKQNNDYNNNRQNNHNNKHENKNYDNKEQENHFKNNHHNEKEKSEKNNGKSGH
jgi:hypothetical protein